MTKKAIIWTSVSVIVIGGIVGGIIWNQNRDKNGDSGDTSDDGFKLPNDDFTSGGYTGGSSGSSSGGSSGGSTDGGSTSTSVPAGTSFDKVKKFFGKGAKDYGNKIVVAKSADDFDKSFRFTMGFWSPKIITVGQNWGLNGRKIYATFYKSGNFFIKIEGMDSWIISGKYSYGGDKMRVTDAKGKWSKNIGRVAELSNPAANIKLLLTSLD